MTKIIEKSCVKSLLAEALFTVMSQEDKFWCAVGWCLLVVGVATTVRYVIWLFQ